jgi:hypothetical protein
LSNAFAVRSNVASSKTHFGDALLQMSFPNSERYFSYPARPRSVEK